ncbi:hypothetical protein UFOVP410_129 [uncultured Caudovirales phage]|uniref:Uncharacterized protein n=1 Tax=uncultured Caudovirales phage TaxID=2100421 RepID=A0A6J5M838_9CAUD|nr:hypothetical protein UFOVP410_129 [uncultured Caudovirales phage]
MKTPEQIEDLVSKVELVAMGILIISVSLGVAAIVLCSTWGMVSAVIRTL